MCGFELLWFIFNYLLCYSLFGIALVLPFWGDSELNNFLCLMVMSIFVARGGLDGSVVSVGEARRGRFMAWHGSSTSGAIGMRIAARIRLV